MTDREKVIKGLELCKQDGNFCYDKQCPYEKNFPKCVQSLLSDALELLKAQEPENILAGAAWVVSYWDEGEKEATITVFNNKEAGDACFKAFLGAYDHVQIDEAPVYKTIIVDGEEYGEKRE